MNNSVSLILGAIAMTMLLSSSVYGQMYHFSNGWNPGKRASPINSPMTSPCHLRPEVKAIVFKLIEDEYSRIMSEQACFGGMPALKSLLKNGMSYSPMEDKK